MRWALPSDASGNNRTMKLVRMTPGQGDLLLAEGNPKLAEEEERLVEEFRRQLELGMWAAVPHETTTGRREATMVRGFSEIPRGAEQVIFFPPAAGGSYGSPLSDEERAADRRAEALLADAAGDEVLAMWRRLGFLNFEAGDYGYLIYAHRPLVAYDKRTGEPLSEFCVRFEDADERLPDADDVLAKWMALRADEKLVIGESNIDPIGSQLDPTQIRRDLHKLALWNASVSEAA